MAASDPTITAPSAGELVGRVREAAGVDRGALALRAGVEVAIVIRAEEGEQPLDGELLVTLLLVLGYESAPGSGGGLAAVPRTLGRYDAEHLAAAAEAPPGEQLERALEWNQFAAELAAAGPPDAPRDDKD